MAFSATLTGTGVSVTLTNGQNTFTLAASNASIVVGSVVQVAGLAAGTKVATISGTTGTLTNNYTGTTGTVSAIFSSIYGSTLDVSLSASGDSATPQNIINAGFATALVGGTFPMIQFVGGLTVRWSNIVAGAVFDFGNWGLYFGDKGRWLFQESSILGELRGGYLVNGAQFIKCAGPSFYCTNWNNGGAGGSSMFENVSGTAATGTFRMHNPRFIELSGSNAAFVFSSARFTHNVENMVLDYQTDSAGANAGIGAAYGILKNTYIVKSNADNVTSIKATVEAIEPTDLSGIPAAVRTELTPELARIDVAVSTRSTLTAQDIPTGLTAAQVRNELAPELGRIDVAVSTRSTLKAQDIPEGLTAAEVWAAASRTLTETTGLTTDQSEQLRKVAQLHGVGADLVVTETTRTAGDVQQTISTDAAGNTTVSAA